MLDKHEGSKMSFLELFQEMDFFSLQMATIGGFGVTCLLCATALIFAIKKEAF